VILYVLLTGSAPFNGKNDDQIYVAIKKSTYSTDRKNVIKYLMPYVVLKKRKISASAQNLISKMLVKNADKRLTAAEVLAHPWFQENKCKHEEDVDFAISNEVLD